MNPRSCLLGALAYNEKQENLRAWPSSSMFKRRLIAANQASVFMAMTFEQRSSTLVLHQMTSDHNRSELGIHDHCKIEPSCSQAGSKKCCFHLSSQDSYITTRVGITIPPSYINAEDNR
ncbi:hypothetical protein Tco_1501737 [Tanacetum coccineum]